MNIYLSLTHSKYDNHFDNQTNIQYDTSTDTLSDNHIFLLIKHKKTKTKTK